MSPSLFQPNSANVSLANAKHVGEFLLSKLGRPNLFDVIFRQLCMAVFFAFFVVCAMSAFAHHISDILGMGSHGEMFGINARGIITGMHDFHSFGDHGFVFNHPGNSVSHIHFASVMDSKLSLATPVLGGYPQPAIIRRRLINLIPKANFKRFIKHEAYVLYNNSGFNVYRRPWNMSRAVTFFGGGSERSLNRPLGVRT